jgi:uroporphyrinogen decarboxylase
MSIADCEAQGNSGNSITAEHRAQAADLVGDAHVNDGLAPVDLERFWADQQVARRDPFGADIPQLALGIMMHWESVFGELGVEEDTWRYLNDPRWRVELNRAYNDRAERIVGRRLLDERMPPPDEDRYPPVKGLHDVFEARNEWRHGSWWLRRSAHNEDELKALLDRVDQRNIRDFILPDNWEEKKAQLTARGIGPPLYRSQRGPVTFATSIYGVENLIYLIMLNPELAVRLRDTIFRTMLEIGRVLDEEAGYTPRTAPRGFSFFDDNCCLLSPEAYELFGYPILEGVFDRYCPDPSDWRYQHSDSAMGHLLPILNRLNMSQVNFGPEVPAADIREAMPHTIIEGQLAPFTFSRNEEENIICELLRDFEATRHTRGLLFATAGSINNGSRLTGMRLVMAGIQRWCRF